jgi:NDP-sugar pyrophosphorylase family protein
MKAMVLAAGLGTRLRPLTDDRPKALVEIAGRTLLEITLSRLKTFGVNEVIVNVHHFADQIVAFLKQKHNFGLRIEISHEDVLLDTGGGLQKAGWFFSEDSPRSEEPFFLHNVDVLSAIDLAQMSRAHMTKKSLVTIAVQKRESSRQLLFDSEGQLCGRIGGGPGREPEIVRKVEPLEPLAFSGIHVISPRLLQLFTEDGVFSIIDTYLRLASQNENIHGFRADQYYWRDLGKPKDLQQAAGDLAQFPQLHQT